MSVNIQDRLQRWERALYPWRAISVAQICTWIRAMCEARPW